MNSIKNNLESIIASLPANHTVTLVAVSKFQAPELIKEAYNAGQRIFGESRVHELSDKVKILPADIKWHFIGHLQTNKISNLLRIPGLAMIESIDSFRLLELVDKEATKLNVLAHVLLEVHVAQETTKFGFETDELIEWFQNKGYCNLTSVHIHGLMGMASNTDDENRIQADFRKITECYNKIKRISTDLLGFDMLSMGMSGDYLIAIKEGANMIRIGSSIFGERGY